MKFFLDTEFIEDGKTIDLISIGIVGGDGREYYAVNEECDWNRASEWVWENVIHNIKMSERENFKPREQIAKEIVEFVGFHPEFWAYYADYDWVVLCQLYGTMMDLPFTWPKYCLDIQQEAHRLRIGNIDVPQQNEHHALADARWNRDAYQWLKGGDFSYPKTGEEHA